MDVSMNGFEINLIKQTDFRISSDDRRSIFKILASVAFKNVPTETDYYLFESVVFVFSVENLFSGQLLFELHF